MIIAALASGSLFAHTADPIQLSLNGEIENNNGKICLSLINNSDHPLDGIAVLAIGSDADQVEIGQFTFHLESRSNGYYRIKSIPATGSFYLLRILSREGRLLLYRAAPIKTVSDASSPAIEVALSAPTGKSAGKNTPGAAAVAQTPAGSQQEPLPAQPEPDSQGVSVRVQLLGSPADPASFAIFFEMRSARPIRQAKLSIRAGKFNDSKPVSLEPASTAQFQLPGKDSDAGEYQRIEYTLTEKDGKELASGALDMDQLMEDDVITVLDVRTHHPSYTIGETAKLTVLLEGRSRNGYRLEVLLKDYYGMKLFLDQRLGDGQAALTPQEFVFILPTEAKIPLVFEYKVFNPETGLLFDSGEFEMPVEEKPD